MGLKNLIGLVEKGVDIADQVVVDQDKRIELHNTLETLRTQLMLSGKGGSITKFTICFLVSVVVLTGNIYFALGKDMKAFFDYALAVSPLIATLTGIYGTFSALKHKWNNK